MNSLVLLAVAACTFLLAYRYYFAFIKAKVLITDDSCATPASNNADNADFIPVNKWVAFGHHFAAISGSGSLIGPILAAQYGWGPGFLWILVGAVFAGAVQDFIILFASLKNDGKDLSVIARKEVDGLTGAAAGLIMFFVVIVTLAGLGVVAINALYKNSWGMFVLVATVSISALIGICLFKIAPQSVYFCSAIGFLLVVGAIFIGSWLNPGQLLGHWAKTFSLTKSQLSIALPVYGFLSAVLPVWLLLVPRGYLTSGVKIGTFVMLTIAIIATHPQVNMPFITEFSGGGPVMPGAWWPYVFVTITCGAISGFHAVISSGTTSKVLQLESHSSIAYGSMLLEGFIAVIALITAVILMPGDYFAINTSNSIFQKINIPIVEINYISEKIGVDVSHRPGGAVSFAVGMAYILSIPDGFRHLMGYWYQYAVVFEALVIFTVIDAGTRVARYVLQDIINNYCDSKIKIFNGWPGILFSGFLITFMWGYLLYSGEITTLWPLVGIANQMLAVVALSVGTTIILKINSRKVYAWITGGPLIFMVVTVFTASFKNTVMYFERGDTLGNINGTLSIILIVLTIIVIFNSMKKWAQIIKEN